MELEYMKNVTETVVNRVAHTHGFVNPRLEFSCAAKKAENFLGQVFRCVLTDENNPKKRHHLIVKLPPATEEQRKRIKFERFFVREVFMYKTVLPTLTDYCKAENVLPKDAPTFPCTATVYALLDEDQDKLIVMEDLKQRGFVMKNRHVGLDENHCRFVLKELARIHATSLALQRDNPELHDYLTAGMPESIFHTEEMSETFQRNVDKFRDAIDSHFPLGSPIRNKVERFLGNYPINMKKIVTTKSKLSCITHGDLWVNNVLFKYEEGTETIKELCFLDLQISRFCTLVTDIWYFLALCTRRSTRNQSFGELIKCYHQSLASFLRDLGHDPEVIVPWNLLQEELQQYGTYGWAMAILILPLILLEEGDIEMIEEKRKVDSSAEMDLPALAEERFVELLEEAEERCLFWD